MKTYTGKLTEIEMLSEMKRLYDHGERAMLCQCVRWCTQCPFRRADGGSCNSTAVYEEKAWFLKLEKLL